MKKVLPWIIIAVVIIGIHSQESINTAVELNQNIEQSWEMSKQLIRDGNDLIGNLVKHR
jgi:hypothetical protein